MENVVFDIKTGKTKIVEVPDTVIEGTETEPIIYLPTSEERLEALEMAMLELAEVLANG